MASHSFTKKIKEILVHEFGETAANDLFSQSTLLQYLNEKTRSASRGSKARSSFGNIYAIYVLVEDYLNNEYDKQGDYSEYEGAKFADLFRRQREMPFGSKLQNHALNHRLNQEYQRFFPTSEYQPIIRNPETKRYWINENLLRIEVGGRTCNIGNAIIKIVDAYVEAKKDAFDRFLESCGRIKSLKEDRVEEALKFIEDLIQPNVDARIFEIVSYSILKAHYGGQRVYWGWSPDDVNEESVILYKTGRTNANDGGIDFVMRPLGRFFQVTETVDVRKYFLDIEKIQRYPITFVVKATDNVPDIRKKISDEAHKTYKVRDVVDRLMDCIEEIINVPALMEYVELLASQGKLSEVVDEVVRQGEVEFNMMQFDNDDQTLHAQQAEVYKTDSP